MSAGPRVLLLTLSERTSGKGNRYLSGWLGKASVVAFAGEPDKHGNPTWDVFVSEPQPRAEAGQSGHRRGRNGGPEARTLATARVAGPSAAPAKPSASPVARGDGWRGSSATAGPRTAPSGLRRPTAGPFYDDDLADMGRR